MQEKTPQHFLIKGIKKVEQKLNFPYNIFYHKNKRKNNMLNDDIIANLLNLSNLKTKKNFENDKIIQFSGETVCSEQVCPRCRKPTKKIHDYRMQTVKLAMFNTKQLQIALKKRRYACSYCGKRFYEKYSFLPKYHQISNVMYAGIMNRLRQKSSLKDIAKDFGVSANTVFRTLKLISFSNKPSLPTILGIDEFKGNTGGEKYNVILANLENNTISDILPTRKKTDLISYFMRYSREERNKVKVFVMDMHHNYKSIKWVFPSAEIVIDRYHFVRQVYFAMDAVRKRVQKEYSKDKILHFKNNRFAMWRNFGDLNDDLKTVLMRMLDHNGELYSAWTFKEWFVDIKTLSDYDKAKTELHNWIVCAENENIPEFKKCLTAFKNWFGYILNSFKYKVSNGFTEGMNNNIKVLKRIAYGFKNFENFRNRILLCFGNR